MGRRLPPNELALYRRCDEVLQYIWDPIGIAGFPGARDEYETYLPAVFGCLREGGEVAALVRLLVGIETGRMGLPEDHARATRAAEALVEWRSWIGAGRAPEVPDADKESPEPGSSPHAPPGFEG